MTNTDKTGEQGPSTSTNDGAASNTKPDLPGGEAAAGKATDSSAEKPKEEKANPSSRPKENANAKSKPARKGGSGFFGGFIGGLISVLLCLGGVTWAVESGKLSWPWDEKAAPEGPSPQELASRLSALETQVSQTSTAIARLRESIPDNLDARLEDLEKQGAQLAEDAAAQGQANQDQATQAEQVSQVNESVAALQQKTQSELAALQDQLKSLRSQMPANDLAGRLDSQASQLSSMTSRLQDTESKVAALSPEVSSLAGRVETVEAKQNDPSALEQAAFALAVANLARAAETAEPFQAELDTLKSFPELASSGQKPLMSELAAPARAGVPTEETLEQRFADMAERVLDASREAGAEKSVWGEIVASASSVVSVRRTGNVAGNDPDAVLARMEQRLKADDLAGAVEEASALQGPAAEAAKPWVSDAEARVKTDQLLGNLSSAVTRQLSEATKGQP